MITVEKFFANLFNKPGMSRDRLLNFATDFLKRLTNANKLHLYDELIAFLTPLVAAFEAEVSHEDLATNLRGIKTKAVVIMSNVFGTKLSELDGVIMRSLGGAESEGYLEFYPNGKSEYNQPTREHIPTLVNRINALTAKYTLKLGDEVSSELLAIGTNLRTARSAQVTVKGDVDQTKILVKSNRLDLELGLTKGVHKIAELHPGDVATCKGLVNFGLLYSSAHHPHDVHAGTIIVGGMVEIINRTFTDNIELEVKNNGTNAAIWIWLGATATDMNNALAIEIQPAHSANIKPSDLGDLKHTFLLVKNDSTVNEASYEVTIIG